MKKIFVGMPSGTGYPHPEVMFSLLNQELPEGYKLIFNKDSIVSRQIVHRARNELVRRFLDGGYDYLLRIDDDNPPNIDGVKRLIQSDKDIVSGIVPLRGGHAYNVTIGGNGLKTLDGLDEIFEIENFGTGFCLLKRQVVKDVFALTGGYPYMFSAGEFVWNIDKGCLELYNGQKDTDKYISKNGEVMIRKGEIGEDLYFGIKAKGIGYKMYANKYATCIHYKNLDDFISVSDIECRNKQNSQS